MSFMEESVRATAGVVVLIAALMPASLSGQSAVGVRGGINLSELSGGRTEGMTGITAGGYFGIGLSDQLALQGEAVFSIRGADNVRIGANDLSGAEGSDVELQTIEVPLLLRAGFPGERFLPSAFVGPYVSFLISCELTVPAGDVGDCDSPGRAAWFSPRATNYGLIFGVALDYLVGEGSVFMDVRYAVGLLSIQAGSDPFARRTIGTSLTGGFAFPIGR